MSVDKTEYQAAFDAGAALELKTKSINGIEHAIIPKDSSLHSFEKLMPAPCRIKASPRFTDIDGFAGYIEEFEEPGSRIFIDDVKRRFVTVFDCHKPGQPAWGDHSASLEVELSREWQRFKNYNEKKMDNRDFAEFIEDNVAYVTGPVSGLDLLAMAQSMKVQLKGELEVEETLHAGMKRLLVTDDSVLRGNNTKKKELEFPQELELALRVFKNGKTYPIKVFLRIRTGKENIHFWIKIPDPEAIEEEAFDHVIGDVRTVTGLPTLKGSFQGPSHKG